MPYLTDQSCTGPSRPCPGHVGAETRGAWLRHRARVLLAWPARRWGAALCAALAAAVMVGVPTDLLDTPLFSRSVPPTWWTWPVLLTNSLLMGLLVATYVRAPAAGDRMDRRAGIGGLLTFLAVGCPVCNKVVLVALGASGAMTWFAPVQPVLSVAAIGLLLWSLDRRLLAESGCPTPHAQTRASGTTF